MSVQIILPRILEIGADASQKLPEILKKIGSQKPLIVTDQVMVKLGIVESITSLLSQEGIVCEIFADTVPEPTASSIEAGVSMVREGDYDAVVAIGGGSPIDSAKAIAVLGKHGGSIQDYRFPRMVNEPGLPIIAIPTTAGTGSEATRVTIITDETNDEKLLCMGLAFMPVAALVDYKLTLSLPARTTADTGIDALTHAMEAFVSQKANPYSDSQALTAMRLIGPNLKKVYANGKDLVAREEMMLGSTLAGIAFSNASVALVHGMSRPIGAFFHVPHGLSNAMLLPTVTEYSIPAATKRYAICSRTIGAASAEDSDDVANEKLLAFLISLNEELAVPTLAEFGADKTVFDQNIEVMAKQALASGSPNNNPRQPSAGEIVELYRKLWA